MKNHLGQYECKLCLTLHNTEVSDTVVALRLHLHTRTYNRLIYNYIPKLPGLRESSYFPSYFTHACEIDR